MSTFAIVETQVLRQISTVGRLMQPSGGTPVALRRLQPQVSFQHGNSRTTRIDMFDTPLHRRQYPFLETDHFFSILRTAHLDQHPMQRECFARHPVTTGHDRSDE